MNTIPFAPSAANTLWSDIVNFSFAIIGTVLFAFALHRLANHYRCYGLPRNLLFGAISGALAFVLIQLYFFLGRNYGLRSLILGELVAGFEVAVVFTVIRRLVFAQRSPKTSLSTEEGSA